LKLLLFTSQLQLPNKHDQSIEEQVENKQQKKHHKSVMRRCGSARLDLPEQPQTDKPIITIQFPQQICSTETVQYNNMFGRDQQWYL